MISGLPHTTTASSGRCTVETRLRIFLKEREPIATTETAAISSTKRPSSNGHERSVVPLFFHPTPQTRNQCPTVRTVSDPSRTNPRSAKHLYEDHESDELGRIDTKRVEQYIDDHDLEESDDATRAQQEQRKR